MTKKHWISVKRGLSEDPKHRQAMGEAIWLFLHIIDAADWEKGMVYDWRDKEIAADMSLSVATVRKWRQTLNEGGYITCNQKQHELEIVIHNWTDPRNYSGKIINRRQGDMDISPSNDEEIQGDTQGTPQGDTQGAIEPIVNPVSFIESTSISTSTSKSTTTREQEASVFKAYQDSIAMLDGHMRDVLNDYLDNLHTPPEWIVEAINIAVEQNKRNWAYCAAILKRWAVDGKTALPPKQNPRGPKYPKGDNTEFFRNLAIAAQEKT